MNKETILGLLGSRMNLKELDLVCRYGNENGQDVDLLVVSKDNNSYQNYKIGNLDIHQICKAWINHMILHRDPLITEPLCTGSIIIGDKTEYLNMMKVETAANIALYLLACGTTFYTWAETHRNNASKTDALLTLSFAYSYTCFAKKYYSSKSDLIFFKDLLKTEEGLKIQSMREAYKRGIVSDSFLTECFRDTLDILTKLEKILK